MTFGSQEANGRGGSKITSRESNEKIRKRTDVE